MQGDCWLKIEKESQNMRVNDRDSEFEFSTCRDYAKASEGIGCSHQEEKETNAL